jgi:hypothetical protein
MGPNILSVTQFGAKGDGVHDDTDPIQAALNAAVNGSTVYFPGFASVYRITRPLTIPVNGVRLRGESTINTDGTQIKAFFSPVPQGTSATLAKVEKSEPARGDVLVTVTGLRDLGGVAPGDTITISGSSHEENNTTSTILSVNPQAGSLVYFGFANIVHQTGHLPLPIPRDRDGQIAWNIKKPMIRCYGADVIFENLSLMGNGTVGAIVDATCRGSHCQPADGGCTNIQFHNCHLDRGVYGVKIADFTGFFAGTPDAAVTYPDNCELFVFRSTAITRCSDSAVYVPNPTGQSKFHHFERCNFQYNAHGIKMRSGSFTMLNAMFTRNSYADIVLGTPTDATTIIGASSELSARFLVLGQAGSNGSFGVPFPVTVQGVRADTDAEHIAPDHVYIQSGLAGGLSIRNCDFCAHLALPRFTIGVAQLATYDNPRLCGLEIVGSVFPCATPATIVTSTCGRSSWYCSMGNTVTQGERARPMTCPNGLIAAAGNTLATQPTFVAPLLATPQAGQRWPANGLVDDWPNPFVSSAVVDGPTRPVVLTGIGAGEPGQRLELVLAYDQRTTVAHHSSRSTAGNRIYCPRAADFEIASPGPSPAYATLSLAYDRSLDGGAGGWRVVHHS